MEKAWLMLSAHLEWRKQMGLDTFTHTEGGEVPSVALSLTLTLALTRPLPLPHRYPKL